MLTKPSYNVLALIKMLLLLYVPIPLSSLSSSPLLFPPSFISLFSVLDIEEKERKY